MNSEHLYVLRIGVGLLQYLYAPVERCQIQLKLLDS